MPYKQKLSTKAKIRRAGYVFFFSLIAGVLGFIIYMVFEPGGGPREVSGSGNVEIPREERDALMEESREAEARFREAIGSGGEPPGETAIEALREAYEKQRRAVVNNPLASVSDRQRLDRLERDLVEHESAFLARRVETLRERAEAEREARNYEAGIALLEEAIEVQERINRDMRESPHSQAALVASMKREIVNWRAEPIMESSREAERAAEEAEGEERWADAVALYTEARQAQARINEEFNRTPFTDRSRVNRLTEKITSLRTREIRAEIASHREAGASLLEEERFSEAAEQFAEALRRQRELNRDYPGSQYASSSSVRELERVEQTARSGDLAGELTATVAELDRSLRERRVEEARRLLGEAGRLARRLESEYRLSEFNDENLSLRLTYLSTLEERLDGIIEEVYERLLPVPGHEGVFLYALETPQSLFARIMNRNPSRNAGEDRPVDSVNWDEAGEFCRRLSWVLGRKVRLPTREEFLAAAGDSPGGAISEFSWHLANSGGESHPVGARKANEHGFHDLWGNVAEWLEPEAGRRAPVAGGGYNDDFEGAAEPPVETVETNRRSRAVGFRFAVEAAEG